jgi:transcriptional regulator with XRE-family HTH domain
MIEFGTYLKTQRQEQGFSLKRLGAVVGVSHAYLWNIEQGIAKPSAAMCAKLADALGLNPDVTMLRVGHLPPDIDAIYRAHPKEFCTLLRRELGHLRSS